MSAKHPPPHGCDSKSSGGRDPQGLEDRGDLNVGDVGELAAGAELGDERVDHARVRAAGIRVLASR